MHELVEIARKVRSRQREERERREETDGSPPPAAAFDPFPPFPPAPVGWDGRQAIDLMEAADGLVERLGVSGSHPDVQDATRRVADTYAARDMELLTARISEFEVLVRHLAAGGRPGGSEPRQHLETLRGRVGSG